MGCSLLSIIEIFYYLFNACLAYKARHDLNSGKPKIQKSQARVKKVKIIKVLAVDERMSNSNKK